MRNTKIVVILLAALAVFLAGLFVFARARSGSQTASATATIDAVEREQKRGQDDSILTLVYDANGVAGRARARVEGTGRYQVGQTVAICYNPADLSSARVADGACG